MNNLLQKLGDNRNAILLAEIGVWLHLLGKLSEEFIGEHTGKKIPKPTGMQKGYVRGIFESMNPLSLDPDFFIFATDKDLWTSNVIDTLKVLINKLTNQDSRISLEEVVSFHRPGDYGKYTENNFYLKLIVASHDTSGAEEKKLGWPNGDHKKEKKPSDKDNTFLCTAFGFEESPILKKVDLKTVRDTLIKDICVALDVIKNNPQAINESYWLIKYLEIVEHFSKAYKTTVGDTQRPVNDVTLWDATSLTSGLFKSALAKMILEGWTEPIDSTKKTAINWKILRINFDSLSLMSKGIKIGDILGYRNAIEKSILECKKIIEIKYCLGNEIYQDQTGIYFSFPDVDVVSLGFWDELVAELLSEMQKIDPEISPFIEISESIPDFKDLTSQRVSAIKDIIFPDRNTTRSQDISNLWGNVSNSEVCPICRLRPMKENSDGCEHCLERRKGRAENWIEKPKETIWLDEASDHNDRVALLVGSFGLSNWLNGNLIPTMAKKTPSSGRVRRCWETTQEFIKHKVFEDILTNFSYGRESLNTGLRKRRIQFKISPTPNISKGQALDMNLEGIILSPVCIDNNYGIFVNTMNLQIIEKWGKTEEEVANFVEGKEVKIKINNQWKNGFTLSEARKAEDKFQDYFPYVQIYDSPDQFMAIVSAYDALDIAKKIFEEYEVQFSKVRDRLPFHIGIIAFHRKTPLYVAIDAGKRLIETFRKKTRTINADVLSIKNITHDKLGNKVKELLLKDESSYSSAPLKWFISYSTGDPNQEDEWHPYFRFNGDNPNRGSYSFDYDGNGNYVVHIKELKQKDSIKIESSYLKVFYLESAAERFKVGDELRPLDDIKRLDELWDDVEYILKSKNLGISQLYAYWQEVKKRYEDYKGDSVWEDFVKSALMNILQIYPEKDRDLFDKLFRATKDGLLDLCLHWNLQVRKIKPEKMEVKT